MIKSQVFIPAILAVLIYCMQPATVHAQGEKDEPICNEDYLKDLLSIANSKRRDLEEKLTKAENKNEELAASLKKSEGDRKKGENKARNAERAARKCADQQKIVEKQLQDCAADKGICSTTVTSLQDTIRVRDTTITQLTAALADSEAGRDTCLTVINKITAERQINAYLVYRSNWWSKKKSYLIPVGKQEKEASNIPGMKANWKKKKASRVLQIAISGEIYDSYQGASIEPILTLSSIPTTRHKADTVETYTNLVFKRNPDRSVNEISYFEAKAASDNLRRPSQANIKSLKLKGIRHRRNKLAPNREYVLHIYDKGTNLSEKIQFRLD